LSITIYYNVLFESFSRILSETPIQ
jgi:hypothetical protein